jgi:hypothetical protein
MAMCASLQLVPLDHGVWIEVLVLDANAKPLPRGEFLRALASDVDARAQLDRCIAEVRYRAVFFEMPPLVRGRLHAAAKFVLVDTLRLLSMRPDPAAFAEHWGAPGPSVRCFANLSGDARLVVPCPEGPVESYVHLAALCRSAAPEQRDLLWRVVAEQAFAHVEQHAAPLWISTAGLGVGWLHVRLDSRPKYYSHRPYRNPDA